MKIREKYPNPIRLFLSLLFFFVFAFANAANRPAFSPLEQSTASQMHAGGGMALESGLSSLWDNPASLMLADPTWEIGWMGFNQGISPYIGYGSPANERSNYALGYFHDTRLGPRYQALLASFTLTPTDFWTGGVTILNEVVSEDFGVDFSAGLVLRSPVHYRLGLEMQHIFQSGYGREPEGYASARHDSVY